MKEFSPWATNAHKKVQTLSLLTGATEAAATETVRSVNEIAASSHVKTTDELFADLVWWLGDGADTAEAIRILREGV